MRVECSKCTELVDVTADTIYVPFMCDTCTCDASVPDATGDDTDLTDLQTISQAFLETRKALDEAQGRIAALEGGTAGPIKAVADLLAASEAREEVLQDLVEASARREAGLLITIEAQKIRIEKLDRIVKVADEGFVAYEQELNRAEEQIKKFEGIKPTLERARDLLLEQDAAIQEKNAYIAHLEKVSGLYRNAEPQAATPGARDLLLEQEDECPF
jgi:DNA repair exonuclease SbcCD ATPase subunit